MPNYTLITEEYLYNRFGSLPEDLQDALASEKTIRIAQEVLKSHHITDAEQALIIEQLTGLVLFGYVHAIDLGREIAQATGLNPKLAVDVADEIGKKVFSPIKDELERNYEPLPEEESSPLGPIMLTDVRTSPSAPNSKISPLTSNLQSSISSGMSLPPLRESAAQAPQVPAPPPRPAAPPPPPNLQPSSEGPVILHQESEFYPTGAAGSFQLEIPIQEIKEPKSGFEEPRRPARLEIGTPPPSPSIARTEQTTPRVVHYGPQDVRVRVSEISIPEIPSVSRVPSPPNSNLQPTTHASPNDININIFNVKKTENGAPSSPGLGIPSAMKSVSPGSASPYPQTTSMSIGGGARSFGSPMGGSVGNTGALPSVGGHAAHPVGGPVRPMVSFGPPTPAKKRGFFAWFASLFKRSTKKEVVFAPKIVTASATMKMAPPRPPVPPKAPAPPPPAPNLQPSTMNPQPMPAHPSLTGEVVDLSTLTREELTNGTHE